MTSPAESVTPGKYDAEPMVRFCPVCNTPSTTGKPWEITFHCPHGHAWAPVVLRKPLTGCPDTACTTDHPTERNRAGNPKKIPSAIVGFAGRALVCANGHLWECHEPPPPPDMTLVNAADPHPDSDADGRKVEAPKPPKRAKPVAKRGKPVGPVVVPVRNPLRSLSPSSASTFRECPRRWFYRYVLNLPDPSGPAALIGTYVHAILEHVLKLPPGQRTLEQANWVWWEQWPAIEAERDFAALELDDQKTVEFRDRAWTLVERAFGIVDMTSIRPVGQEIECRSPVGGILFKGFIDLVEDNGDGTLSVTDWKSGKPSSPQYAGDKIQQITLYAHTATVTLGRPVTRARLVFLGDNPRRFSPILEIQPSPDDLARASALHRATWFGIEDLCLRGPAPDAWPANPQTLCQWCPYVSRCPEGAAHIDRLIATKKINKESPVWLEIGREERN